MAKLVTNVINSDASYKVEYVEDGKDLSSDGEVAFNTAFNKVYSDNGLPVPSSSPNRTGTDISLTGTYGFNAPTSDGSHSFIVNNKETKHPHDKRGITSIHEIFGHGMTSAKKMSNALNNANAIRAENLVLRV